MKNIIRCVFIATLVLFITSCNKISSSERLNNAQQEYKNHNYPAVIILLKNFIRDKPNNKEARILMAKSHYQLGNFLDAEKEYLRAIDLGVNIEEISYFYVTTLYAIEDHIGVTNFWEQNISILTNRQKADIAPVVSLAYLHQTSSQKSFEVATKGKDIASDLNNPELIMLNTAIANSYIKPANIDNTIKELKVACESYPTRWVICELLANALFSEDKFSQSAEVLKNIIANKPNHTMLVIKLADSYVRAENTDKAWEHINALLKIHPKQPYINLLAATIELKKENFIKALNHINTSINSGLVNPQTKLIASLAHYHLGNDEQALFHLQSLKTANPNNALVTRLYVAIQLRMGDADSISTAYSQAAASEENSEIFALASLALLKAGDSKKSARLIKVIDTSLITNQKILNSISLAKLASGDTSGIKDIEKSLNNLVKNNAAKNEISNVKFLLISSLLASGENKKAIEYVNNWSARFPNEVENKLLLVEIEKKSNNKNNVKIESLYKEVITLEPGHEAANVFFGQKSMSDGEFENSSKFFHQVINNNRFNFIAIRGYIFSQDKLNNRPQTLIYLEGLYPSYEVDLQERIALAQLYLFTEQPKKATVLLKKITEPNKTFKTNMLLAEAYIQTGNFVDSIDIYKKSLTNRSPDRQLIAKLAIAYEMSNNLNEAVKVFEKLKSDYPSNTQIGLVLANFQLFVNKQADTILYIESLTDEQQSHPAIIGLRGKAYYFSKQYAKALPFLKDSYIKTANKKLMPFIFDSKIKLNQVNDALAEMGKHLANNPEDITNRIYYATELNKHDQTRAINQYEQVILADKSNILALNNLAWLLYETGSLPEAKKYIDRAIKIAPNNSEVIDTNNKIKQALNR
ncbi:PEP-CTERM system TPR-repeat protein PrsT [Colwellia sp. BRX8-4]|uniref:XrtA/PEP-CTERM system TPR-repeat protein PrsT n=1 Tax=Colwellia sp. BRX8-4 TaxID=2759836 RepID=UPI0015F684C5|nr:XrtA/PEP-CTERM system TPR-repeat protein PrsT [Colwellia sp. BRX8-4]MBA6372149.1 PEP-CTERM system TPR-repeat protein PrsT [Colwellia sp. BRX8-4]